MNGLELNHSCFRAIQAELQQNFPNEYMRMAAGLVGNGSECFGYDDDISRDHDWGAGFQIWLEQEDAAAAPAIQSFLGEWLERHPEYPAAHSSDMGADHSVTTVGGFYESLTGCPEGPHSYYEWDRVPQENLAMAVNGQVFYDGTGHFTAVRNRLLQGYPEPYRMKKLAARCAGAAQTGQYNAQRCLLRGDEVTMYTVVSRFIAEINGLVFLLNRRYLPYYKWQFRALSELPLLGREVAEAERQLIEAAPEKQLQLMEKLCSLAAAELRAEGLSTTSDDFLLYHGQEIQQQIKDPQLRDLPVQYG